MPDFTWPSSTTVAKSFDKVPTDASLSSFSQNSLCSFLRRFHHPNHLYTSFSWTQTFVSVPTYDCFWIDNDHSRHASHPSIPVQSAVTEACYLSTVCPVASSLISLSQLGDILHNQQASDVHLLIFPTQFLYWNIEANKQIFNLSKLGGCVNMEF